MKTTLLYASSMFFLLGTSFAHEVAVSPAVTSHKTIVERRVVQMNTDVGAMCSTNTITTMLDGVKVSARQSVNCDE